MLNRWSKKERKYIMKKVYEIDTWRGNDELNRRAIEAAKNYKGKKFTVAIGEWGTKTFPDFLSVKQKSMVDLQRRP